MIFKNRKAQSALSVLFILLVIGLVYFFGLSGWVATTGAAMSAEHGDTGLWAFFASNLNIVIGLIYFMALIAVAKFGF